MSRPAKRQKVTHDAAPDPATIRQQRAEFLNSLSRDVSPPPSVRAAPSAALQGQHATATVPSTHKSRTSHSTSEDSQLHVTAPSPSRVIASPFKLTAIRDLPASSNIDTVSLGDILGDPLIKEAWIFNFCFDVDWMMQFFDEDIRHMVQVKVIHGSWKQEDGNRIRIVDACTRWKNVEAATAYLPDPFGTHHSKMFVLFSHDGTAEVIIHTANMLEKDWTNMTQAVWRSGPLPKSSKEEVEFGAIGTGARFKYDFLEYLKTYKKPVQALMDQLRNYDFASVRGALVASVPAKIDNLKKDSTSSVHLWGYPQLREVIRHVKNVQRSQQADDEAGHLVAQVSSIATLPAGWLNTLYSAFHASTSGSSQLSASSMSLIYPTAPNVGNSLDGYAAGGSIHTKAQSATHLKQIDALRPHLCQWTTTVDGVPAGRATAAPHIKTYIQFDRKPTTEALEHNELSIEWALMTSANLSTQAWGSLPKVDGKGGTKAKKTSSDNGVVHIQSFEIGVLVWPELFQESSETSGQDHTDSSKVIMVPVFGKDTPERILGGRSEQTTFVGLRMPYDLPLTPYDPKELPWSPGGTYMTPDSHGRAWLSN